MERGKRDWRTSKATVDGSADKPAPLAAASCPDLWAVLVLSDQDCGGWWQLRINWSGGLLINLARSWVSGIAVVIEIERSAKIQELPRRNAHGASQRRETRPEIKSSLVAVCCRRRDVTRAREAISRSAAARSKPAKHSSSQVASTCIRHGRVCLFAAKREAFLSGCSSPNRGRGGELSAESRPSEVADLVESGTQRCALLSIMFLGTLASSAASLRRAE